MPYLGYRFGIMQHLATYGLLPTIDADTADDLLHIAEAIVNGGVRTIEVCFRDNPGRIPRVALDGISRMRQEFGKEVVVGCGTTQTPERAQSAIDAGAQFVVSNVCDPRIIEVVHTNATLIIPGARDDTAVHTAMRAGCLVVKLLMPSPSDKTAENIRRLGQYRTLFPKMTFTATMGITPENIHEFLDAGCPFVASGNVVPKGAVQEKDWDAIEEATKTFADAIRAARKTEV